MKYRGSCHCGKVAYEVEGEIQETYSCNCSICSRRGSLLWFAPREKFRLLRARRTSPPTHSTSTSSSTGSASTAASCPFAWARTRVATDGRHQHPLPGRISSSTRCRCSTTTARRSEAAWTDSSIYARGVAGFLRRGARGIRRARAEGAPAAGAAGGVRNRRALPDVSRVRAVRGGLGLGALAIARVRCRRSGCSSRASCYSPAASTCCALTGERWLWCGARPLGGLAFLAGVALSGRRGARCRRR